MKRRIEHRRLFVDQYGNRFYAQTVRDLRSQIGMGGSRVSRMYRDRRDGSTRAVGYVIGQHWLTEWAPVETEVTR
jgi:hypothetical protein